MLLTGPSMARTLTASGAAEAASVDDHARPAASAGPYSVADAEVPDLSEASEPDGARGSDSDTDGAPKVSEGSPSDDVVAQNNAVGRVGDTVHRSRVGVQTPSDGPSTGPSTPTGNWLQPQQLEHERWVSEDAAFNDPGAWGDGGALLGGSDAPVSPRIGPAALDMSLPALLPAPGHGGSATAGIDVGHESPVTVSRILADSSTPVTAASDGRPLPPILVPPKAPDALGEAAAHALTLPGRPGARPAQQESNGHLRRGRSPNSASVDGATRVEGRSPSAQQERRHSLPAMPFGLSVRPLDSVAEVLLLFVNLSLNRGLLIYSKRSR